MPPQTSAAPAAPPAGAPKSPTGDTTSHKPAPLAPPAAPGVVKPTIPPEIAKSGATDGKPEESADPLKVAADAAVRRYKLQVDGKEVEVDEQELISRAQKATGAEKKFEEAARVRRMMETFIAKLKDPDRWHEVLRHPMIGHDPMKLAEELVWRQLQEEKLTPEQKQVREAQEILKRDEQRKKLEEQSKAQQRMAELQKEAEGKLTTSIKEALETSGLPKSAWTVRMMAYFMHKGWKQYNVRLNPADVVPMVKKQYQAMIGDFLGSYEGDIFDVLGEPVVEKIRTGLPNRLRNPEVPVPPGDQPPASGRSARKPGISMQEWQERNERIKAGLE